MVKLFLYTLVVIVSAVALTLYFDLLGDPGYLLLAWRSYTLETSLFALVVFAIVVVILLRLVYLLLAALNPLNLIRSPGSLVGKARKGAQTRTTEGLLHFVRGDWEAAHRILERSLKDRGCPLVSFLAAAYAACEVGQNEKWEDYLGKAAKRYPADLPTINAVRADLLMKVGHLEQSLAVLEQVRKTPTKDRQLPVLLKEAYIRLEDWDHLHSLLPELKKAEVLSDDELSELEKLLFKQELSTQVKKLSAQDASGGADYRALIKKWNKAPARQREDQGLAEYFVDLLVTAGANQEAAQVIESTLEKYWNDRLINLYGELQGVDHTFQLTQAKDWLQQRPNDAGLLTTLGRLSMRSREWRKACEYFETSLKIAPSAAAYGELARLLNRLGDANETDENLAKFVALSHEHLPDLPLPESTSQVIDKTGEAEEATTEHTGEETNEAASEETIIETGDQLVGQAGNEAEERDMENTRDKPKGSDD